MRGEPAARVPNEMDDPSGPSAEELLGGMTEHDAAEALAAYRAYTLAEETRR